MGMSKNIGLDELSQSLFWRDVSVEVVSTFLLMSVQCSLPLTWGASAQGWGSLVQVAVGMGFVVCALGWTFGDFGGCVMNPAVTFAFVISKNISAIRGKFCSYIFLVKKNPQNNILLEMINE